MSGAACAAALATAGRSVTLFDKARGPSGRLSSRRRAWGSLDLGAPSFRAVNERFSQQVQRWERAGVLQPWTPQEWVGVPRMSALCRHLIAELPFFPQRRLLRLEAHVEGWTLCFEEGPPSGPFEAVVLALPSDQLAPILGPVNARWAAQAARAWV